MPRKKATNATDTSVLDYRYAAKRKNIPPAGLAAQGRVRETPRMQFAYDPHLPPVLRFDSTGASDKLKGGRGMPCPYITNYDSKYRMGRDTGED